MEAIEDDCSCRLTSLVDIEVTYVEASHVFSSSYLRVKTHQISILAAKMEKKNKLKTNSYLNAFDLAPPSSLYAFDVHSYFFIPISPLTTLANFILVASTLQLWATDEDTPFSLSIDILAVVKGEERNQIYFHSIVHVVTLRVRNEELIIWIYPIRDERCWRRPSNGFFQVVFQEL
ncbi:hypothetical protein EGR_05438 [Echinococcus granulosus]|uniref:Uncharacterized protein n=1 Tax=Echinococcus granulosus TaxID=6210 RepID=W6UFL2_ECHGR|nr:hypothetical protein EGR_05438 [Echinococcus granulosus]EUB59676.1 hypothetical protein EGR_05438 [Echinococcus granulosus]